MSFPDAGQVEIADWAAIGAEALPLRMRVFVQEQGVPEEMELDEFDPLCRHALVRSADGTAIATGRLLPDGRIGRMAVDAGWRGRGLGGAVLEALVAEARRCGLRSVRLHGQLQALPFYSRHGFVAEGEVFDEVGIAHRLMCRTLARQSHDGD